MLLVPPVASGVATTWTLTRTLDPTPNAVAVHALDEYRVVGTEGYAIVHATLTWTDLAHFEMEAFDALDVVIVPCPADPADELACEAQRLRDGLLWPCDRRAESGLRPTDGGSATDTFSAWHDDVSFPELAGTELEVRAVFAGLAPTYTLTLTSDSPFEVRGPRELVHVDRWAGCRGLG